MTTFLPLPDELPLFPLYGVLLLPRGRLPLNIFERRTIALVDRALAKGRLIGMIQPLSEDETEDEDKEKSAPLYQIGCAGKIVSFSETDDGRYLVSLQGISRFRIKEEIASDAPYRLIRPDWAPFGPDLAEPPDGEAFDRIRLMASLRPYFKMHELAADWVSLQNAGAESLISALSMICPFEPNEKQGLLEAKTLQDRASLLIALLEMATLSSQETETAKH